MAFRHGVFTQEVPTSLISPTQGESGLPVIVGTAPIHLADPSNVNKPQLCYSYAEAVELFGFSKDFEKYTLCEFIYSQFALYGMSPCVLINVLDPSKHKELTTAKKFTITSGEIDLGTEILEIGFEAANQNVDDDIGDDDEPTGRVVYAKDTDYSLAYDEDGNLIFSVIPTGALANQAEVYLTYTKLKPESVSASDVIGGVNAVTGKYTGLELVNQVFPKFRLIPGLIGAPKFSELPEVAAVMVAKAENVNGIFTAQAVVDIPSDSTGADVYSKVAEWKNRNNYSDEHMIACWPKVKLGDDVYHLSTQLIGLMNSIDNGNDDVPYQSPSNNALQINACVNAAGEEINLGLEEANYLNGQGVVVPLNFIGGWKAWGNRTAIYPANTDVKDSFISVRRMFDWVRNDFITMFWQEVDSNMTPRLIRTIVNSYNMRLNGLQNLGVILGGRVEFLSSENPTTDLLSGILRFHIYFTPAPPAEQIISIVEFYPDYMQTLFAAAA